MTFGTLDPNHLVAARASRRRIVVADSVQYLRVPGSSVSSSSLICTLFAPFRVYLGCKSVLLTSKAQYPQACGCSAKKRIDSFEWFCWNKKDGPQSDPQVLTRTGWPTPYGGAISVYAPLLGPDARFGSASTHGRIRFSHRPLLRGRVPFSISDPPAGCACHAGAFP